jgi:hypothetical protein
MTYIPRQTKLNKERIEAKLETGLIEELTLYCEYFDSDRDYVISQALEIAFRKDKGFAEWRQSRTDAAGVESPGPDRQRMKTQRARTEVSAAALPSAAAKI